MGPQPFGCGRMLQELTKLDKAQASMGPQPFGCGRSRLSFPRYSISTSFNGAATFRLRKDSIFRINTTSYNASMGPQPFGCGRAREARAAADNMQMLQWGRNLSVAEGRSWRTRRLKHGKASMGPQPFGCGRSKDQKEGCPKKAASMGPQPFGCGRARSRRAARSLTRASMGPQPFGCGRAVIAAFFDGAEEASMGPQPFGCGRGSPRARPPPFPTLQWGRNLSVAEGRRMRRSARAGSWLQWGRNLSVAEGQANGEQPCQL